MNSGAKVRYMRLIVFFDLPVKTAKQRKDYRQFRKFLLKDGYLQLQESVYAKLVAKAIQSGECEKGILICGTGIGISITANKFKGIRAVPRVLRWLVCTRIGHLRGLFRS